MKIFLMSIMLTTALAAEDLPPLAQYVAYVRPLQNPAFRIEKPVLRWRKRVPGPRRPTKFIEKLIAQIGHDPRCPIGNTNPECPGAITAADYGAVRSELAAEFKDTFATGDSILITAPLRNGQPPGLEDHAQYPPDQDSRGQLLIGNSVQEIAHALAELPGPTRRLIHQVDMLKARSPWDKIYSVVYQRPTTNPMRVYMQALPHPLGVIVAPPQAADRQSDPALMASTLAHEAGHIWSFRCFGTNAATPEWTRWRQAAVDDGNFISQYAQVSFLEDAAEMALGYAAVISWNDTPTGAGFEKTLSGGFPNRWRILGASYPRCGHPDVTLEIQSD